MFAFCFTREDTARVSFCRVSAYDIVFQRWKGNEKRQLKAVYEVDHPPNQVDGAEFCQDIALSGSSLTPPRRDHGDESPMHDYLILQEDSACVYHVCRTSPILTEDVSSPWPGGGSYVIQRRTQLALTTSSAPIYYLCVVTTIDHVCGFDPCCYASCRFWRTIQNITQ